MATKIKRGQRGSRSTSTEELHATYLSQKRYLLFFSGVLFLTGTIDLAQTEALVLPGTNLHITSPQELRFVLYGIVAFYLWQLSLFWDAQGAPTRERLQHLSDHWSSLIIGFSALLTLPVSLMLDRPAISVMLRGLPKELSVTLLIVLPFIGALLYWLVFMRRVRTSQTESAAKQQTIVEALRSYDWELIYDPLLYNRTAKAEGSKQMRFGADGEILEGGNYNENFWTATAGYLQFYNQAGELFSRFQFQPDGQSFVQTRDFDTMIEPVGQRLVRRASRALTGADLQSPQ